MRDPNRIDKFCNELAKLWHKVPDWRLGQFIMNMERMCRINYGKDIFYMEDEELIEMMKNYFKEQENA